MQDKPLSKRSKLSELSSLYDPLGSCSCYTEEKSSKCSANKNCKGLDGMEAQVTSLGNPNNLKMYKPSRVWVD